MDKTKFQQLLSDLDSCGMSIAEMSVLSVLLTDFTLPRENLVRFVAYVMRDDNLEQPKEHYARAVESCLEKGWIAELSETAFRQREQRLDNENIPFVGFGEYGEAGHIDLTEKGYAVFSRAARSRYPRSGMRCIAQRLELEIYGDSRASCCQEARNYQDSFSRYSFNAGPRGAETVHATLVSASEPVATGPWRFNRFEVVPDGFLIVLKYHAVHT